MSKVTDLIESAIGEAQEILRLQEGDEYRKLELELEHIKEKHVEIVKSEGVILESELVKCRDCKHGQQIGGENVLCEYGLEELRPMDHFCAWGEARSFEPCDDEE